jgi:cytochrome c
MDIKSAIRTIILGLACLPTVHAARADERVPTGQVEQLDVAKVDRAKALLAKAVAHYRRRGEKALTDFDVSGRFEDGELYVYVLATDGKFLASGGSSSVLVGRNVAEMRDSAGKPFFKEILKIAAEKGSGHVEYRWLNRLDKREERKLAFFQRVGERIIAVGFYIPRATEGQARTLLDQAAAAVQKDSKRALVDFNDLNGPFVQDDLYVFAVDMVDMKTKAHGSFPHLVGGDASKLTDANGRNIVVEMRQKLQNADRAEIDYTWRNPVTRQIESKRTFIQKVDRYIVGVGYYPR